MSELAGKSILITGGTGSFGRAFLRIALTEHQPRKLIVFSRDECKQWEMQQHSPLFRDERLRYFLGDVRDRDRLMRAVRDVDYVVHAAALKHVPAAEYNPSEFIKTNIDGAMNLIDAALERGVEKVIALSTDKAANPINLYGATKLCSDKLFVHGNAYAGAQPRPSFSVVRYGNVLGSRGSIVQSWKSLLDAGATELPLTDPRMTRFWITLDEAVRFTVGCLGRMCGGELFVPKTPSMALTELGRALDPNVRFREIGIRPGEKLHEMLISEDDARRAVRLGDSFVIAPEGGLGLRYASLEKLLDQGGTRLADGFRYSSDSNDQWLSAEQLRAQLIRSGMLEAVCVP
jgi:UDP-N-acetylglucosamine 4,6-dehydratase